MFSLWLLGAYAVTAGAQGSETGVAKATLSTAAAGPVAGRDGEYEVGTVADGGTKGCEGILLSSEVDVEVDVEVAAVVIGLLLLGAV